VSPENVLLRLLHLPVILVALGSESTHTVHLLDSLQVVLGEVGGSGRVCGI